jgi:hypothetical protein
MSILEATVEGRQEVADDRQEAVERAIMAADHHTGIRTKTKLQ